MQELEGLTKKQFENTLKYVDEIINNLPDKALFELLSGYDNDVERLFSELLSQTSKIINYNKNSIDSEKLGYLSNLEKAFDDQLKIISYNYFKTTCLPNFNQGWRNLEWGNLVQLYDYLGVLAARSHGKCFSKGTKVIMWDGTIKSIENIEVGDKVMGPDNKPRTILSLHSGVDDMYEVEQKLFKNYTVNSRHDMYFKKWSTKKHKIVYDEFLAEEVVMEAKDFFNKNKYFYDRIFGVGINGWDLPEKNLLIEPYFLGLWLGDGNSTKAEIASIDFEVIDYVIDYTKRLELDLWHPEESIVYGMVSPKWMKPKEGSNLMLNRLKKYNLLNNKHIPEEYLTASRKQRLELLAGLIDSDGHKPKDKKNSFVFTQKDISFCKQFQKLCWSLGFRCNISENTYKTKYTKSGEATTAQIHFSGDLSQIPCKISRKKVSNIFNEAKSPQRRGLRIKHVGKGEYFGFTCDKDHLFILEDGTIVKNSFEFCHAYPLWKLYSYNNNRLALTIDSRDNRNRKETLIITNTETLGKEHLVKINEEIKFNDVLAEKLNPNGKASLGATSIVTETGSKLHLRGVGGFFRGLHTGSVICDDMPDESSIYSKEQRVKLKDKFYAGITPIVEPGGQLIVDGTPYSADDIYNNLKDDSRFVLFEYPAVFPDGKLLSPDRFTFSKLLEEKESLGSLAFSREYLVVPVSDDSTIFPYEFLLRSIVGMENVDLVENIEAYPFKLRRVVIGCDFAKSANVGADYTVYTVWGVDENDNYYLLHIWRKQGASHNEQISQIVSLDQRFKPNKIVVESNGFQGMLADMAKQRGLRNIQETITGSGKKSWFDGLPSLAALFERGQIKIPYKIGKTREMSDILFGEFNSISFRSDKGTLEAISGHDDICMSSYFGINDLRENKNIFRGYLV
jgi:phage terminase large subunit-like protein